MCGLNGIFAYHSAAGMPTETELTATRDAMRSRGPDGAGMWWSVDRRCALGHRRLTILDLSDRASQPMVSDDGSFAVVFNGEIYNYPELRAELEAGGVRFRTTFMHATVSRWCTGCVGCSHSPFWISRSAVCSWHGIPMG
jgi:asparagine synthase (glutamine-hydrolysing)